MNDHVDFVVATEFVDDDNDNAFVDVLIDFYDDDIFAIGMNVYRGAYVNNDSLRAFVTERVVNNVNAEHVNHVIDVTIDAIIACVIANDSGGL